MNRLVEVLELVNKENEENRRRALHNYDCKTSELQPYDISAHLRMVSATFQMLREMDEKRKAIT